MPDAKLLKKQRVVLFNYIDRVRLSIIESQNNVKPPLRASGKLQASLVVDVNPKSDKAFLSSHPDNYLATTYDGVGTPPNQVFPWRQLNQWLRFKGIQGVRDKRGRFLPRNSIAYLMALKIWKFGSAVHRGERAGVPIFTLLKKHLPRTSEEMAVLYAQDFADDVKKKLAQ